MRHEHSEHRNQNKHLRIFIITTLVVALSVGCVRVPRNLSKIKAQESVALDVAHSPDPKILLEQEKQHLGEIDALIKTMSLEELIAIVMLDVADSKDDNTSIEEKTKFVRQKLNNMALEEARAHVSVALVNDSLVSWKDQDAIFIGCKSINAKEKL